MRFRTTTLLILSALPMLPACSDSSGDHLSMTELSTALPTVDDLGSPWTENHRYSFDSRTAENPPIDASYFCPAVESDAPRLADLTGPSGAEVEMKFGNESRTLRVQLWDDSDAKSFIDLVSNDVTTCDGATFTDETVGAETTVTAIDGPALGDASISWLRTSTPPSDNPQGKYAGSGRTSVVRFGTVIMFVHLHDYALEPSGTAITDADWATILQRVAVKVSGL